MLYLSISKEEPVLAEKRLRLLGVDINNHITDVFIIASVSKGKSNLLEAEPISVSNRAATYFSLDNSHFDWEEVERFIRVSTVREESVIALVDAVGGDSLFVDLVLDDRLLQVLGLSLVIIEDALLRKENCLLHASFVPVCHFHGSKLTLSYFSARKIVNCHCRDSCAANH